MIYCDTKFLVQTRLFHFDLKLPYYIREEQNSDTVLLASRFITFDNKLMI